MRRLIMVLIVVVLFAAACGDDGGVTADFGGDDSADGGGDSADGGDGGDDGGGDSADGGDDGGDSGGDDGGEGAGVGGDFCESFGSFEESESDTEFLDSPDDFEAAYREIRGYLDEAVTRAPAEIKSDVETLADGIGALIDFLEENDWNFFAAVTQAGDDPRLRALDDPDYAAAIERISRYCGLPVDADDFDDDYFDDDYFDDDFGDGGTDSDPSELSDQERAITIQVYMSFGHDRATAECLVDEIGDFLSLDDSDFGPDTTFCGLTVPEIVTGG